MDGFVDFFAAADPRLALLALTLHLANIAFRSLAWTNVLRAAYPDRRVPLLGIAGAYAAGMALNSFVPARGGDVAKIALARTRIRGSSVPAIGSSMGVLAAFDAVVGATVILLLAAFGRIPSPPGLPGSRPRPGRSSAIHGSRRRRGPPGRGRSRRRPAVGSARALALAELQAGIRDPRLAPPLRDGGRPGAAGRLDVPHRRRVLPACGAQRSRLAQRSRDRGHGRRTVDARADAGRVGTQQVMLAYLLHTTASTATIVSFSIGMQAAVTTLNVLVGLTAAMLMLRTLRPMSALRALRQ